MADGKGPGRFTLSGVAFGGSMLALIVAALWFFISKPFWFPTLASVHGAKIDSVFAWVLIVCGIAFVIVQAMLGYFVARFGASGNERAEYWHDNPKLEAALLVGTSVILTILVFMGQRVWAEIYFSDKPENAIVIQATGEQFAWNFQYPGPDGAFGRTDPALITSTNSIGLDRNDPAGKDDIAVIRNMHIPVGRAVIVRIRSKDVIHSFFLPNFRVKQDAVPGMAIETWFTAKTPGVYEIACAELCGQGHYRMKGELTVDATEQQYNDWLTAQAAEQ